MKYKWVVKKDTDLEMYGKAHIIDTSDESDDLNARCGYRVLCQEKSKDNYRWFYLTKEYKFTNFCKHCLKAFERFKILQELGR